MAHFSTKKGSTARSIRTTLTSSNSTDDLSNPSSVVFYMRPEGSSANKINGVAAVVESSSASQIVARYDWQSSDVDTPGLYYAYWKVTWPSGKTDRFPSLGHNTVLIDENYE